MRRGWLAMLAVLVLLTGLPGAFAGQSASTEYAKANNLLARQHYEEALVIYQTLLSSPSSGLPLGVLYTKIGDCHFRLNDYRNALYAYREALPRQKRPERPATQYWIGFCNLLLGKNEEAVTEFLKVPSQYPESGMWVGTSYYWAGRASERMGNKEQAAEFYRKAGGRGKTKQEQFALKKAEAAKRP